MKIKGIRNSKHELAIIDAMCNPENWRPNHSKISKETGVPVSTCFDIAQKNLMKHNRIKISIMIEIEPKDEFQKRVIKIKEKWGDMGCCLKHPKNDLGNFWSKRTNSLRWGCVLCDEEEALEQDEKWKGTDAKWQKKMLLNNGIVI